MKLGFHFQFQTTTQTPLPTTLAPPRCSSTPAITPSALKVSSFLCDCASFIIQNLPLCPQKKWIKSPVSVYFFLLCPMYIQSLKLPSSESSYGGFFRVQKLRECSMFSKLEEWTLTVSLCPYPLRHAGSSSGRAKASRSMSTGRKPTLAATPDL